MRVRLSASAQRDLARLPEFLAPRTAVVAARARAALVSALDSLGELPRRGRPLDRGGLREVFVSFGRDGYVFRYRASENEVFVTRIFHARERR
ncbi:type II toxin-antitoxin system RelE/ParE family toxin [Phenylobacterium sp.]|uniref:type II toxin-antitoxin system RelE/ParE family toxin n=1 Tax=Phenylobacterium sp. TaxID=1871053 RepID=UPI0038621D70